MTPDDKSGGPGRPDTAPKKTDGPIIDLKGRRVDAAATPSSAPAAAGSVGTKPPEIKPSETKPPETKPTKPTAAETKPTEFKPTEFKPTEFKPAPKPADAKPSDPKAAGAQPEPAGPAAKGPVPVGRPVTSGAAPAANATGSTVSSANPAAPSASAPSGARPSPAGGVGADKPQGQPTSGSPGATVEAAKSATTTTPTKTPLETPPKALGIASTAPSTAAPGPRAARRPAALPALAAGLLGVLVGAGMVYGYEIYGPGGDGETDARVAALEQRLDGLASRDALAAADRRLGALETALRPLPDAVREARSGAEAAGAKAQDALEQASAATQAAKAQPAPAPSASATVTAPAVPPELQARLGRIEAGLGGLQEETRTKLAAGAEAGTTLERRLGALDQALTRGSQSGAEATQALTRRLDALAKTVGDRPDAAVIQAGLKVGAANRIALALASGAPYADALAALRSLKVDDAALAPLARFAETGAPTASALAQGFGAEAQRIAAAERAARARSAASGGSFTDKLASMAESIVTVRRSGAAAPEAAGQEATQVAGALDRGDVGAAARAWAAMPETARNESAAFGARLKARADADEALRGIANGALAALPGGGAMR